MLKMTLYLPRIFGVSIEVYFILLLLGVPTFLIWRWFLKKFIKVDRTRKIATWTVTLVTTPLIYVGLIILLFNSMFISFYPTHDFDKEKWFADKEKRYELSEDIIDSKMLIGKTKAEVRQMLGDERTSDQSNYWEYYLGFKPGFVSMDPDMLHIEFKDGQVIKVEQYTH